MAFSTEQESFWAGEFGDEYTHRNKNMNAIASNIALFSKILEATSDVHSVIEFGANVGLNLMAIKRLCPDADLSAIEINDNAAKELRNFVDEDKIYHMSILDFNAVKKRDFVLIKGVLIHLDPQVLDKVYSLLYDTSSKYICIAEYYNPTPVEVEYRGYAGKLFKRDFAGEMLDKYKDLELVKYGFAYHRDNNYAQDDLTWFLLKKKDN